MSFRFFLLPLVLGGQLSATAAAPPDTLSPADTELFEKKIRPVLVEHCYSCHSEQASQNKQLRGGLRLDSRAGIRKGGDSGPAIVAGKPAASNIKLTLTLIVKLAAKLTARPHNQARR